MKLNVRDIIQLLVLRTSFFPLNYIYRLIYSLSIIAATFWLSRVDGVLAVYLRRGAARGEIIYGLSDIDMTVIIKDGKGGLQSAREKIRGRYGMLSKFIPLFGGAERELGLYSASEFLTLYNDYDYHKYRFNEGRYTWKLLYGRDIVKELPPILDTELYIPATEELKAWWAMLNTELVLNNRAPVFKRKYLWYKAISEASKVFLFVCHGVNAVTREDALSSVGEYLSYEHVCVINRVREFRNRLNSKDNFITDELMKLFVYLTARTFEEMERKVAANSSEKTMIVRLPDSHDLIADRIGTDLLEEVEKIIEAEFNEYVDSIAIIPQVEFELDVLSNSDIDSFYFVLGLKQLMPIERLAGLRLLFDDKIGHRIVEPFILVEKKLALSLYADRIREIVKVTSPTTYPLFFALLPEKDTIPPATAVKGNGSSIRFSLPSGDFKEAITKRAVRIDGIIAGKDIYKMRTLEFIRFFWAAARTKLLADSLVQDEIHMPLTSKQILDALVRAFPDDAVWLSKLHEEYMKELRGMENEAYQFYSKSVGLLNRI